MKPPLQIEVQRFGFQDQEDWTLVENEERSVGTCYVSTEVFASVQASPSINLQRVSSSSKKVGALKPPLQIEVQRFGFQDQEDWTLVENEERSVGTCYVSTEVFASVQASPSINLQRVPSSSKSEL